MPKNTKIKNILVIGSGPINIGQACEFDYSGTQAIKALKEEGFRVILVNSNPATIMTDKELADATYIEPLTLEYITAIIDKERPDALIATLGGQTSLNCALMLHKQGVLEHFGVKLIGASIDAILLAEDRVLFHQKMQEIGLDVPKSKSVSNLCEAMALMNELGLPLIARTSFSLGGKGAAILKDKAAAENFFKQAFLEEKLSEITLDEALIGYKEFELEVVRDSHDNCIVVCGVENFDPLGIHTGDSITVAPIQTLTDPQYQLMREASFKVLRAIGVDTGGSNVQFAVNPNTGRMVVIEMNPRVSRSSALVSKATGFPIAKIAAKLAVGYTLDELTNDISQGGLPASFEPSIDYVVVKIPRFDFQKFNSEGIACGPQMLSIGEVMAIGSSFAESLQLAMCSLETGVSGFDALEKIDDEALKTLLAMHGSLHLWHIAESFRRGLSDEAIQRASQIDPWFLQEIKALVAKELAISQTTLEDFDRATFLKIKKLGFSDKRIASLTLSDEADVRSRRQSLDIYPVYKCVDSCAGEFASASSYLYSTYQQVCESKVSLSPKIMIIGSGPNRIGQGIEFDYVCVKAIKAFSKAGFETIMLNCNPETVSTDYDCASKLYFVPLSFEKVMDVIEKEKPDALALQFGGQTPLNLIERLEKAGVPLIGLDSKLVQTTEDRDSFRALLSQLGLKQPANCAISLSDDWEFCIQALQFPLIIRPSFVLGGGGMEVVEDKETLFNKLNAIFKKTAYPVLLEEFLEGAIEVDVDAVSDGIDVFIPSILEHIEPAGIHSGDSACITPPVRLSNALINLIHKQTAQLARALQLKGLMNIQFAIKDSTLFLIEVNPRASRTTPFICKATGIDLVEVAVKCMLGISLKEQRCLSRVEIPYYCVKEAVLPFQKFALSSPLLSPEMKSTGEVMGIGHTPYEAYLKAQIAAGNCLNELKEISIFISGGQKDDELTQLLIESDFMLFHLLNKEVMPSLIIALNNEPAPISFALKHNIPYVSTLEAAKMLLKSLINTDRRDATVSSLQMHYQGIRHPSKIKHLLTGTELSASEMMDILKEARAIKQNPSAFSQTLANQSLVMLFEKPSFRTRLSFTIAIQSMGGNAMESVSSTRKKEEPKDLVRVLNAYADFIMLRTHNDAIFKEIAIYSTLPIINGLSALHHPCQILADLLSLQETFGTLDGLKLAYIGDGNNILHSLLLMATRLGIHIHYCCPAKKQPNELILEEARLLHDDLIYSFQTPIEAVTNAHAVYTDVWASMGFEEDTNDADFKGFQVSEHLLSFARSDAVFMHCMPMERGKEVSETLPDCPSSIIFRQSENRMHVQKALLLMLSKF